MKIERINENKIKVIVNRDDVKVWNVDLKNFTDNTPEAQDLFWFAIRQAEQDVDFRVGKAQLLVETLPTGNDGFVMIISKLESESDVAEALMRTGKRVRQAEFNMRRRSKAMPLVRVFGFDDFESLCTGVAEISEMYLGESRLFKYNNRFYLELVPRDSFGLFEIENLLSEFAERVKNPSVMQGLLNEYGEIMIEADAVEVVTENFAG